MRVVESTCHKISLYSRRIISLLPDAVIACRGCIVGISKRWRRNRSGVRVGVEKLPWRFRCTAQTICAVLHCLLGEHAHVALYCFGLSHYPHSCRKMLRREL